MQRPAGLTDEVASERKANVTLCSTEVQTEAGTEVQTAQVELLISTTAVVEQADDLIGNDAAESLEVEIATAAESARVEIRRVSHLSDDPNTLAKIAFIRLFRSKLCTTVQAPPIVRGVLCAEGYAIDEESLQLLCKTVAGTFH